jgi:bifunctional ADP-heptose synthase (sugar kinase/adenylyltransferase)
VPPEQIVRFLEALRARHPAETVLRGLASLRTLRALVVGEAIIDEYNFCTLLGKSPKEAIVTTKHLGTERQAGGALVCANHVAGFCERVDLVSGLGDDGTEGFARERLAPNVTPRFFVRPGTPTIVKRRYLRQPPLVRMFEVVVMDDSPLPEPLEEELIAYLSEAVPGYDLVVVADYGHGLLSERAARTLAERSRFLAVSTQANAENLGFNLITKYPGASYACVDESELRLAMQDRWSPLPELASRARHRLACRAISVTRGRAGAVTCGADGRVTEVPAFAEDAVDPLGAGDAYLAITAPCVAAGMELDLVGFLGCVAGSLAVQVVGNRAPVDPAAVRDRVGALLR